MLLLVLLVFYDVRLVFTSSAGSTGSAGSTCSTPPGGPRDQGGSLGTPYLFTACLLRFTTCLLFFTAGFLLFTTVLLTEYLL